jgi:hypothetical protein
MLDLTEEQPQPFRRSAGFYAFLGVLLLPLILALAVFAGAWAVSDEVAAAESSSSTRTSASQDAQVEGWKKTLVGICPVH